MNFEFKSLRNIETSFQMIRMLAFAAIGLSILFCLGMAYWAFDSVEKSRQRVYVLENGRSLTLALANEKNINIDAEIKDHVETFHKLFFQLDPNEKAILRNMKEASYLGDRSIVNLYNDNKEKGYYTGLIQGNVITKIEIDSVVADLSASPYHVRTYAKQSYIRSTNITIRHLFTDCYLINTKRTDENSHGFLIERLKVLNNSDIQTIQRDVNNTIPGEAFAPISKDVSEFQYGGQGDSSVKQR